MTRTLLAFFSLLLTATVAHGANKPNIVVFIADDHGQLDSSPYGAADLRTPNMDRLAADGMTFTHAFVASPACGPSRTAMLTGLWSARNGAEPNHRAKNPDVRSLPPLLHALGYEVAAFGKVAHSNYAKDHGFDVVRGIQIGYSDTVEVAEFLKSRDASKPLCLFYGTRHPHVPWGDNSGYDPAAIKLPPTHVDTAATRTERARYYSDVTRADVLLGELRELANAHVPGDTLFIYTADHGAQWPFAKWNLYDAGTRVPFLASWPGRLKPGSTSDALICWPDLLPTFLELGGGAAPAGIDGRSFAGVLRGTATTHRDRVFATHSGDGDFNVYPIRSVRTRDWKYIRNLHPEFQHHTHISRSSGPSGRDYWQSWVDAARQNSLAAAALKRYSERPSEELYNLATDPFELHNLADDPAQAERLRTLRADLAAWMKQQGDRQTVFGKPLLLGEAPTLIAPGAAKPKPAKSKASKKTENSTTSSEAAPSKGIEVAQAAAADPKAKGKSAPRPTIGERFVYKKVGDREMQLFVVKPADWKAADRRPALVLFHGGGWVGGGPTQFNDQAKYLASRGLVCVQVEYRLLDKSNQEPPIICTQDAKSAIRWVRSHAAELGIDPQRVGAGGGSAGGHLAAFVGLVDGGDDPQDDLRVSAKADALVLFNPVFDNGSEGGWGQARVGDRVQEFSPAHNISKDDPPAIIFLGTRDNLIPVTTVERFQAKMKAAGIRCEAVYYDGRPHGFFNDEPWKSRTFLAADQFLASLGWLEGPPTLKEPATDALPTAPKKRKQQAGK